MMQRLALISLLLLLFRCAPSQEPAASPSSLAVSAPGRSVAIPQPTPPKPTTATLDNVGAGPIDRSEALLVSSNVLAGSVEACQRGAVQADPGLVQQPGFTEAYCGCTVDALVANAGTMALDAGVHTLSYTQLEVCAKFAQSSPNSPQNPFSQGVWSALGVARQIWACDGRPKNTGAAKLVLNTAAATWMRRAHESTARASRTRRTRNASSLQPSM